MYPSNNTSTKESFTVSNGWNETYKLPARSFKRTVCLFWQQGIRDKIGNKGGEDLYLQNILKWKQREKILSSNC